MRVLNDLVLLLTEELVHIRFMSLLLELNLELVDLDTVSYEAFVMKYRGVQNNESHVKYPKLSKIQKDVMMTYPVQRLLRLVEKTQHVHLVHVCLVLLGHQASEVAGYSHRSR